MYGITRPLIGIMAIALAAIAQTAVAVDEGDWINLFDGESLFGFNQLGDAHWEVKDGVLTCESGTGGVLATTSRFRDFELWAKVRVRSGASAGIAVRAGLEDHFTVNGGAVITIPEDKNKWHEIRITVKGKTVSATLDGAKVAGLSTSRDTGHIAIFYHRRGARVDVSELKLRPLNMDSLFNGKNLDGWNIIPGRKSKFQVVDGALNILDGNGQIETAGVYKDFMLQLEIISNGDHLNSGVFFRSPVGVFWKGYESQVRNEWRKDDRTKPVDYGTGGIYGNQAARKVVPSDHEWFKKTIVCEGNHMAVWINGYQVSDYTDTRPISNNGNGKAGFVPGPGTIHLQGHDPTTNLSFNNINIQVYP